MFAHFPTADDNNSDNSARQNNLTFTDESLDSCSGELPADCNGTDEHDHDEQNALLVPEVAVKMYKTLAEFESNLPPTVKLLQAPDGAKVYVVGTAHFSRESMDDVSLVSGVRPVRWCFGLYTAINTVSASCR